MTDVQVSNARRIGFTALLVIVSVILSLPNWGPCTSSLPLRHENARRTVDLGSHGQFDIVGYAILMFDHVSIETSSWFPFMSKEILRIDSGSRDDYHARDVQILAVPGGIRVRVKSRIPTDVFLSSRDVAALRWNGPRWVIGGQMQPLSWSIFDALDGAVVLALAAFLYMRRRSRLSVSASTAEANPMFR